MTYEINSYPYFSQDGLYNAYLQQYLKSNYGNVQPVQNNYQSAQTPVSTQQFVTMPDTVKFSAQNQIQSQESEGLSSGAKWGIGATGTILVGAGILYGLYRHGGIKAKNIDEAIESIKKGWNKLFEKEGTKASSTPSKPKPSEPKPSKPMVESSELHNIPDVPQLESKGIAFDEFKKSGHTFNKGIALNEDGTKFNGIIEKISEDGTKYSLKYHDGKIIGSYKNGKIWKRYIGENDVCSTIHVYDHENKTLTNVLIGNEKLVQKYENIKFDEKTLKPLDIDSLYMTEYHFFRPDGSWLPKYEKGAKLGKYISYPKDGKIVYETYIDGNKFGKSTYTNLL